MKIIRDIEAIDEKYQNAVIALGNFDGVHLGHRSIISAASKIAKENNLPLALMSFEPHPREFFVKNKSEGLRIYGFRDKLEIIKSLGIEILFLLRFNEKLASLSAEDFIKNVLVEKLKARHIVTGENFYFGQGRKGDKNLLTSYSEKLGFEYLACPSFSDKNGNIISSSAIRELLKNGEVVKANELLGEPYHISGRVKRGEGRGRKIGFPTANISLTKLFLPKFGVYAVRVHYDNKACDAVANLGVKPTFGVNKPLLEIHLFDVNSDLYGKNICVEFVDFIRAEKKFNSVDELKEQIAIDCNIAQKVLS